MPMLVWQYAVSGGKGRFAASTWLVIAGTTRTVAAPRAVPDPAAATIVAAVVASTAAVATANRRRPTRTRSIVAPFVTVPVGRRPGACFTSPVGRARCSSVHDDP